MRNKFETDGRKQFSMQKRLSFGNDHRGEVVAEVI